VEHAIDVSTAIPAVSGFRPAREDDPILLARKRNRYLTRPRPCGKACPSEMSLRTTGLLLAAHKARVGSVSTARCVVLIVFGADLFSQHSDATREWVACMLLTDLASFLNISVNKPFFDGVIAGSNSGPGSSGDDG